MSVQLLLRRWRSPSTAAAAAPSLRFFSFAVRVPCLRLLPLAPPSCMLSFSPLFFPPSLALLIPAYFPLPSSSLYASPFPPPWPATLRCSPPSGTESYHVLMRHRSARGVNLADIAGDLFYCTRERAFGGWWIGGDGEFAEGMWTIMCGHGERD